MDPYSFDASKAKTVIRPIPLLAVGAIGVGLIAYFAISNNYLAALFFFVALITLVFGVATRKGRRIICTLKADGIAVNRAFYPYSHLKSFWIFYDPPSLQELSIKSKKVLGGRYLRIPLESEDPVKIREVLLKFLPEKREEQGLASVFAKIIGL
jgi:hypothetical protein